MNKIIVISSVWFACSDIYNTCTKLKTFLSYILHPLLHRLTFTGLAVGRLELSIHFMNPPKAYLPLLVTTHYGVLGNTYRSFDYRFVLGGCETASSSDCFV